MSQQPLLHLYGWTAARLPEWFTERFPAEYHRKRLFNEQLHLVARSTCGNSATRRPGLADPHRKRQAHEEAAMAILTAGGCR